MPSQTVDFLFASTAALAGKYVTLVATKDSTVYAAAQTTNGAGQWTITPKPPAGPYKLYSGSTQGAQTTLVDPDYMVDPFDETGKATYPGSLVIAGGAPGGVLLDLGDQISHYDNFQRPNGLLGTSASGDVWTVSGIYPPTITNNKYTIVWNGGTGAGSSYAQFDNGSVPYAAGASFTFSPGTTDAVLAVVNTADVGLTLQNLIHFICNTKTWILQKRKAGTWTNVQAGSFFVPLVADGATEYTVYITYAGSTVYLLLPDGSCASVTDPDFLTLQGPRQFFEPTINLSTDMVPQFTRVWIVNRNSGLTFGPKPVHASLGDLARVISDAPLKLQAVQTIGSLPASNGIGAGIYGLNTMVAQANNDNLYGLLVNPTFNDNGKTGVSHYGIYFQGSAVSYFGGDIQVAGATGINFAGGGGSVSFGGKSGLQVHSDGTIVLAGGATGVAAAGTLRNVDILGTLTASQNGDVLYGLIIEPTFADAGHTGVSHYGLWVNAGQSYFGGDINPATQINFTGGGTLAWGGVAVLKISNTPGLGFYGTAATAKQTVTGSKSANAALTSLMAALSAIGLVTDSTT